MPHVRRSLAWLVCLGLVGLAGCGKKKDSTASGNQGGPPSGSPMGRFPMGPGGQVASLPETGPHAAGIKVFNANGCARCHSVGGAGAPAGGGPVAGAPPFQGGGAPPAGDGPGAGAPGFPGRGGPGAGGGRFGQGGPGGRGGMMGRTRGPDLAKTGQDPTHTVEWFMSYVRNPKSYKPNARMPSFEGKINDADLQALAGWLASLK